MCVCVCVCVYVCVCVCVCVCDGRLLWRDLQEHTTMAPWYERMTALVGSSSRKTPDLVYDQTAKKWEQQPDLSSVSMHTGH